MRVASNALGSFGLRRDFLRGSALGSLPRAPPTWRLSSSTNVALAALAADWAGEAGPQWSDGTLPDNKSRAKDRSEPEPGSVRASGPGRVLSRQALIARAQRGGPTPGAAPSPSLAAFCTRATALNSWTTPFVAVTSSRRSAASRSGSTPRGCGGAWPAALSSRLCRRDALSRARSAFSSAARFCTVLLPARIGAGAGAAPAAAGRAAAAAGWPCTGVSRKLRHGRRVSRTSVPSARCFRC